MRIFSILSAIALCMVAQVSFAAGKKVMVNKIDKLFQASLAAKDSGKGDEIQAQYYKRLLSIDSDLLKLEDDNSVYYFAQDSTRKLELLESQYLGHETNETQMREVKNDLENSRIVAKTAELEKARADLKLDALKYYKGKMPKWLKGVWNKEDGDFGAERLAKSAELLKKAQELSNKKP